MHKEQDWAWDKTDATEKSWLEESAWMKDEDVTFSWEIKQLTIMSPRSNKLQNKIVWAGIALCTERTISQHSYGLTEGLVEKTVS